MWLLLRACRHPAILLALAGGWSMARGQESQRPVVLNRLTPTSDRLLMRSDLAPSERRFTPHEIWGEAIADPQVQASQAAVQLPSPEQTIGVPWDEPYGPEARPHPLWPPEPPVDSEPIAVPRMESALPPDAALMDELPASSWRRHIGWGEPLVETSWRERPWFAGALFGGAFRSDPADDVRQTSSALAGIRLGWDLDHYYGIEGRYAFSSPQLADSADTFEGDFRDHLLDVSALYYPLGDARWRPYFGLGVGLAAHRFQGAGGQWSGDTALSVPVSLGVKYFYSRHFTLRLDAVDNVTFGSDTHGARNHFFLLGSVEYRFGGRRMSDVPWEGR